MKLPILVFDSECPLCVRFTQALKLVDKNHKIHYVSVYEDELYAKYPFLDRNECEQVVHLVLSKDEVLKGGQVVSYLVKMIPAVEKFAWLINPESSKKASEAFYKKINDVRKFVKKHGCKGCGGRSGLARNRSGSKEL